MKPVKKKKPRAIKAKLEHVLLVKKTKTQAKQIFNALDEVFSHYGYNHGSGGKVGEILRSLRDLAAIEAGMSTTVQDEEDEE